MTIKELQAELARRGVHVTQAWIKRRFILVRVERATTLRQVLREAMNWNSTPEGYTFWRGIYHGRRCVALPGVAVPHYAVIKKGKNWKVGCQILTERHRLNLFRLLAEDLGYEIED